MSEFINKVQYLIEKDGLNERNRKREIMYRKCYLQSKLRESGMNLREIGAMFNQHHASIIHNIRTHHIMSEMYSSIYSAEISEYVEELTGIKVELKQRDLIDDIVNCKSMYQLRVIKRRIKEKKYEHYKTKME